MKTLKICANCNKSVLMFEYQFSCRECLKEDNDPWYELIPPGGYFEQLLKGELK